MTGLQIKIIFGIKKNEKNHKPFALGLFGRFRETPFLPGLPVRFGTAKITIIWPNIFRSLSVIVWIDSLADK